MKEQVPQPSAEQRAKIFESLRCIRNLDKEFIRELAAKARFTTLKKGDFLHAQGDSAEDMHIIINGRLQVMIETWDGKRNVITELGSGSPVGVIALLAGGKRNATVLVLRETTLAELKREDFEAFMAKYPDVKQKLLNIVSQRLRRSHLAEVLPQYFEEMNEATFEYIESLFDWVHLKRGEPLFKKGDIGDSLYILINGLLHVVEEGAVAGEGEVVVSDILKGEIVGEMALLSDERRESTIYAARDSDLVKLARSSFESISDKYPSVMIAITRLLVERLKSVKVGGLRKTETMNIAVFPITPGVPAADFSRKLEAAFSVYGLTFLLTAEGLDQILEKKGIADISDDDPRIQGLRAWLSEIEDTYSFTIYQAEKSATPWTRRCLDRADQVILLADANASPGPGSMEQELLSDKDLIKSTHKVLVLIHPDDTPLPSGTAHWLDKRQVHGHYHIRRSRKKDYGRLARILSNRAIGLALGGGAAKGSAHIGVIRALEEAGIPIDMVAGASIGAIVGAHYAMGNDYDSMLTFSEKLMRKIHPFRDYTLPIVSLIKGRALERLGKMVYGDCEIEDLWRNFYCVSTNLSRSEVKIHHRGLLRNAVRTSCSVPGVIAPVFQEGEVYVDGGVINNLPGDVLRRFCGRVIVVEVTTNLDLFTSENKPPSSSKLFWSKIFPFTKSIKVPNILDILLSTILTGSFRAAHSVKHMADLSLTPPLTEIGFLDFKKAKQAAEIGYRYTREALEKLDDPVLITALKGHAW